MVLGRMKFLIGIILLFWVSLSEAQQLSVKSFQRLENDLSARGSEGRVDQNGDKCAIIKIVTTETGFDFDPDALGSIGNIQKKGEWLYVPYGARRLTVRHAQLGVLRNYACPERMKKACVYELALTTKTVVEKEVGGQWLVLSVEPKEAMVNIDDVYEAGTDGMVQKFLPFGHRVSIQTDRLGDVLFVDGHRIGLSPQTLELSYGAHIIRADREGESTEKEIEVLEGEGKHSVELGFGLLGRVRWSSSVTFDQKRVLSQLLENMVKVKGGSFQMGDTSEQGSYVMNREKPIHTVKLSDYYICKYEVSQQEWEVVMGNNPSHFQGKDLPVEQVSWEDCQAFIQRLNTLTGLDFKLPTEAQWEYAARGGNKSQGTKYSGSNTLSEVGWSWENSGEEILGGEWKNEKVIKNNCCTHPVGQKRPNELGLYDMSGNVWEWCSDRYGGYNSSSETDPMGPGSGSRRVTRGGCWSDVAGLCRVSYRGVIGPGSRATDLGLRLVL